LPPYLVELSELEAAVPLCQEAIDLAGEAGGRFGKMLAHRTLAEAIFCQDPADRQGAESALFETIRIQREIGTKPELARRYVN
jgi:hypothetical protein